jgi:hypothetical protein
MLEQTIWLHRDAPPKPPPGAACNGCGVCCTAEPCPAGILLTLRLRGRCRMLRYDDPAQRCRCGLMPQAQAPRRMARAAALRAWPHRVARTLVARWIGVGRGCDSTVQATAAGRR